jgi:lipoate-protein ligase A
MIDTAPGGWKVRRVLGDASCLHNRPVPDDPGRLVWVFEAVRPALVLGSTQSEDLVDLEIARAFDVAVARRRSGGGAVMVVPGNVVWIDVVLPAGDPLWHDDVAKAPLWLGETWRSTLDDLGVTGTEVHHGPLSCGPLGRLVCFATVGAGEVTLGDRKLVGISQRRTRTSARFQCALYREWDPAPLIRMLRLEDAGREHVRDAAVGTGLDGEVVVDAFLRHLPA